jgi:hypothetical protein
MDEKDRPLEGPLERLAERAVLVYCSRDGATVSPHVWEQLGSAQYKPQIFKITETREEVK